MTSKDISTRKFTYKRYLATSSVPNADQIRQNQLMYDLGSFGDWIGYKLTKPNQFFCIQVHSNRGDNRMIAHGIGMSNDHWSIHGEPFYRLGLFVADYYRERGLGSEILKGLIANICIHHFPKKLDFWATSFTERKLHEFYNHENNTFVKPQFIEV